MMLSDVCLLRTSGLSRERRGLGRLRRLIKLLRFFIFNICCFLYHFTCIHVSFCFLVHCILGDPASLKFWGPYLRPYSLLRLMKKSTQRRCKHCALAVVRRNQKFSPRRRPPSRGRGTVKIWVISWRWSLLPLLPTNPVW